MKKSSGFIGILAVVFFNILFVTNLMAETTKEIVVNDVGIYHQTVKIERAVNWKVEFPEGFTPFLVVCFMFSGLSGFFGGSRKFIWIFCGLTLLSACLFIYYPIVGIICAVVAAFIALEGIDINDFIEPVFLVFALTIACIAFFVMMGNEFNLKKLLFISIVFVYSLAIREVIYAWRKQKFVTPEMVEAEKVPIEYLNEEIKIVIRGCKGLTACQEE